MFSAKPFLLTCLQGAQAGRSVRGLRSLVLMLLLHPLAGLAQTSPIVCVDSPVQPESVDLDSPASQLARPGDLVIPPGARIARIRILRRPLFDLTDPDQNNLLYRGLNALNIPTWESALRSQLLMREGDTFEPQALVESERLLRQKEYLTAAWVGVTRVCGDAVEISVLVRDTWTLLPSLGFSRSGGENSSYLGLSDPNFLGSGKSLSLSYAKDADRSESSLQFDDPNVLGSRWQAGFGLDERSDGNARSGYLEHPFHSERAPWRFGIGGERDVREESLLVGAQEVADYRQQSEVFSLDGGWLVSALDERLLRLLAGYRHEALAFDTVAEGGNPDELPSHRTLSYPWIGLDYRQDRFRQLSNLTLLQQVEDVRDGFVGRVEVGYSATELGATEDRVILNLDYQDALLTTAKRHVRYAFGQTGSYRLDQDRVENLEMRLQLEAFLITQEQGASSWYARIEGAAAHNLTADRNLLLGGDVGLRGYPSDYQQGDRGVLVTLERRYFPDWYPFQLFRLGGLLFTDVGRAWYQDGQSNGPDGGWLTDVGFGLRLASPRIEVQRMLHLDFAFPLDGDDSIEPVQILLRGRSRF